MSKDICKCGHEEKWHIHSDGPSARPCVNSPCACANLEIG